MNTNRAESTAIGQEEESALTARTRFIEAQGRKLAYRCVGKGDPILLCNRFRGNLDTWDPAFIDNLARHFQVITFTYTGLGRSTGAPNIDVLSLANDAKAVAEGLNLEKIILVGWSLGGMVAQTVAMQYPELVTQVILIGTAPPGENQYPTEGLFLQTATKPENDLADEYILFFEPKSQTSRAAAGLSHDRIAQRTQDRDIPITRPQWETLFKVGADFHADHYHTRDKMKATRTPLLVISGDHDLVFPVENWYALTRELPTLHLIVFPQAGHGPQHQFPEASVEYITTFIRTNQ